MIIIEKENYVIVTQDDSYKSSLSRYLDRLDLSGKYVFVSYFEDLMYAVNIQKTRPDVSWLYEYVNKYKDAAGDKKFIFMVDGGWEGPTYRHNLKYGMDNISAACNIPTSEMIIYGGAHSQFGDPVKHSVSIDMSFSQDILRNVDGCSKPTHHFISLARIAKPHRVYATIEMLDRGLDKYGYMSLGCGYYSHAGENFDLRLVPEKYRDRMPLYIDGPVIGTAQNQQHVAVDERFYNAFVNVIMETSYDANISPQTWNSHMISEKTTKAFSWGQIPLFITLQNSVQYLRDYGFDVFDDVIDHNYYDGEVDGRKRIEKAIDELQRICNWDIEYCREFKKQNIHRFLLNNELCEHYQRYKKNEVTFNNLTNLFNSL